MKRDGTESDGDQRDSSRPSLTTATLHVLLSLADGKRHGYGIKIDVEERTQGQLRLGPGTLYEAIHRMERDGWLEAAPGADEPQRGKPRKYYRMTDDGRERLAEELSRLRDIVDYAHSKDLLPEAET